MCAFVSAVAPETRRFSPAIRQALSQFLRDGNFFRVRRSAGRPLLSRCSSGKREERKRNRRRGNGRVVGHVIAVVKPHVEHAPMLDVHNLIQFIAPTRPDHICSDTLYKYSYSWRDRQNKCHRIPVNRFRSRSDPDHLGPSDMWLQNAIIGRKNGECTCPTTVMKI